MFKELAENKILWLVLLVLIIVVVGVLLYSLKDIALANNVQASLITKEKTVKSNSVKVEVKKNPQKPSEVVTKEESSSSVEKQKTVISKNILNSKGVYVGRVDDNFIKINVLGVDYFYLANDSLTNDLAQNDEVEFKYFLNTANQPEITEIYKTVLPATSLKGQAIFIKLASADTVKMKVDTWEVDVQLSNNMSQEFKNNPELFHDGDIVSFDYYKDSQGKDIITWIQEGIK